MKRYNIKVNGSLYEVEVEELATAGAPGDGSHGKSRKNKPQKTSGINGPTNVHDAVRAATGPGSDNFGKPAAALADVAGQAPASVVDADTGASGSASGASVNSIEATSPMPGTVLEVKVAEGQQVQAGDTLIILEAMKMENEIPAPEAGTIVSVAVEKGATVNAGDLLAIIE